VIFDGKAEDFAAEMFVIINSTPTRINKSHLIDLYERIAWAEPEKKLAARIGSVSTARGTARCATGSTASAVARSRRSGFSKPSSTTSSTVG
jgi:hypothetical protein